MSREQVTIPATIEEAKASLDGLGQLLTARSWERAAIVYAFTEEGTPGPKPRNAAESGGNRLSFREFAALGLHGLRKEHTVGTYHARWAKYGDPSIQPGDTVTLPDEDWPPNEEDTDNGRERLRISPTTPIAQAVEHVVGLHGAEAVAREMAKADPEAPARIVKGLSTEQRIEVAKEAHHDPDVADALYEDQEASTERMSAIVRHSDSGQKDRVKPESERRSDAFWRLEGKILPLMTQIHSIRMSLNEIRGEFPDLVEAQRESLRSYGEQIKSLGIDLIILAEADDLDTALAAILEGTAD